MQNVEIWIHGRLSFFLESYKSLDLKHAIIAAMTLVDFPEFRGIHEAIFEVLGAQHERHRHDDHQWDTYHKYRQFLSEFLLDQERSGTLFVEAGHYLKLAKYLWSFIVTGSTGSTKRDILL
jgi:hypothetical protein